MTEAKKAHPTQLRSARSLIGLDLLRGMAALEVFIGHLRGGAFVEFGSLPSYERNPFVAVIFLLTRMGDEAVMVFFVLSGFLVGGQVIRHLRQGRFNLLSYGIDRSTRIFTPLVPACILTGLVIWLLTGRSPAFSDVVLNMVGLNGVIVDTLRFNAPLWSLAYEIWFYIAAGSLAYLVASGRAFPSFIVLLLATAAFTVLSPLYLLFWSIGAVAANLLDAKRKGTLFTAGAILAAVGIVGYQLGSGTKSFTNISFISADVADLLVCAGTALTMPLLADPKTNRHLRFLSAPALYLSSISYSLYLFHYPLESVYEKFYPKASVLSAETLGNFSLRLVIIFACVNAFYLCFEARTPFLRRRLKRWTGSRSVALSSEAVS